MMQPSAHEVIDVVTMRHGFVPAGRAVLVCATGLRSALHGIGSVDRDDMFVDVILMHMVEVAIMQIVDVPFMADAGMSTVCAMLMGMVGMVILGAGGHGVFSFFVSVKWDQRSLPFGSMFHRAFHQTQDVTVGERIVDVLCRASPLNKPHLVQHLEAARNGRHLLILQFHQLGHTDLAGSEPRQQP
jgi:hypothetical protein